MTTRHPVWGVLLFVCGLFLFSCMDTTVKVLTAYYPVPVIAALRYIVHLLLMVALLGPRRGKELVQTVRTGWVIVRGASLCGATLFLGLALKRMPVAETTAIAFLSPLVVIVIAGPLLKEDVGIIEWMTAIAGFIGILLIAHPGSHLDPMGIVYALGAVVVMVAYQLLSRILAATERTLALLFYTALTGAILFGLTLPFFWTGPLPPPEHMALFLLVGASGGLGHFLFTAAYQQASASVLGPLMYIQLVWASLLGWLVFGHIPDHLSLAGMCVVAGCGVVVALKARRTRQTAIAAADLEP